MKFQFSYIALFVCLFAIASLPACTQMPIAGAQGSARGLFPVIYQKQPEIQPWCDGHTRMSWAQCGAGN